MGCEDSLCVGQWLLVREEPSYGSSLLRNGIGKGCGYMFVCVCVCARTHVCVKNLMNLDQGIWVFNKLLF